MAIAAMSQQNCREILEELNQADETLLKTMEHVSVILELLANKRKDDSAEELADDIKSHCQEFLSDIEACQRVYLSACESQAGRPLPYAVSNPSFLSKD